MVNVIDDKEKKARQVLKRLYKGFSGQVMSREEALAKIGITAFQNNTGPLFKYGLVEYDRADGLGRKILTIKLTEKGRGVLDEQQTGTVTTLDPLTSLDAIGEFVERFNSRNKYWELKLAPKETADHR